MLLTSVTAWAQDNLPSLNPSLKVVVENEDGASGTVSVSYTNTSGTTVTEDITSGGRITTSSSNEAFTLTITPAAGCEIVEFKRARLNDISYPSLTENNGHFTYSGTSTKPPFSYNIKFGPKSDYYFVNFTPGYGSGTMTSQAILKGETANLTPCTFTGPNGKVFDRWTTNLNGTGISYADGASITLTATITLYAQWMDGYAVHFDANGGTGTMANQSMAPNASANLRANTFTREGYVFAGWNTVANGSGTSYTDGERVCNLAGNGQTVNLYAQWTQAYTVHFDANGGSGTMADQTFGIGLAQALTANAFTREGYYFGGWNTQADGLGTAYNDGQSVADLAAANATVSLYAQWRQPVTADYVDASGNSQTLTDCKEITPGYMPTTLAGNYYVSESVTYTSKITVSGPTTIVLANGKTMSIGTEAAPLGGDYALYGSGTNNLTIYGQSLDAATAGNLEVYSTGYSAIKLYSGSYAQHSGNVKVINSRTSGNNKYALNAGGNVIIDGGTFVATIGTEASYAIVASGSITISGGSVTATATGADSYGMRSSNSINLTWTHATDRVTASGYKAIYGTVSLSKRFAFDDGGTVTLATTANMGGQTLRPAALVTFEANGGSDVAAQPVFIGTTATAPTPSRTGYDFGGWTLGGNAYDFSTPVTDDITLTAQWDIIQFVVDGLRYEWNGNDAVPNSVMVIDNELGDDNSVTIPNTVEHNGVTYDVTAIGDNAFVGKEALTSISFPANLVSIGSGAFKGCISLSVTIPAGVTLGSEAFNGVNSVTALLADNADNSALISSYFDAVMNVPDTYITLSGRTLLKDGSWNTLCLPFSLTDVNIAEADSPLTGATIKELDNSADGTNLTDGTLTLKFKDATEIEAGKPYIVKWETKGDNITNPTFRGASIYISAEEQANMTVTSYDQNVKFVGQWSPFTIGDTSNGTYDGDLNEILYVASGNKIGYSSKARTLKSCRAHFWVKPNGTDAPAVNSINIDFGDNETTEISEKGIVNSEKFATAADWYTLDGRKFSGKPTKPGLYINNGRKTVIK